MDEIGVKFGRPTFIEEIVQQDSISSLVGQSVCITGRLTEHQVNQCIAVLCDPLTKKDLQVDTSLIEPFEARIGSLFQMIGELEVGRQQSEILCKARVVRCVDGLDMSLYKKAIQCQRDYLEKRKR